MVDCDCLSNKIIINKWEREVYFYVIAEKTEISMRNKAKLVSICTLHVVCIVDWPNGAEEMGFRVKRKAWRLSCCDPWPFQGPQPLAGQPHQSAAITLIS